MFSGINLITNVSGLWDPFKVWEEFRETALTANVYRIYHPLYDDVQYHQDKVIIF